MPVSTAEIQLQQDETYGTQTQLPLLGSWVNTAFEALQPLQWGIQEGKLTFDWLSVAFRFTSLAPSIPPESTILSAKLRGTATATSSAAEFFTLLLVHQKDGWWDNQSPTPFWRSAADHITCDVGVQVLSTVLVTLVDTGVPGAAHRWNIRDDFWSRNLKAGQSVTVATAGTLGFCDIRLSRSGVAPVGNIWCEVYAQGADGLPTGAILATSNLVATGGIVAGGAGGPFRFTFSGGNQIPLALNQKIVCVVNGDWGFLDPGWVGVHFNAGGAGHGDFYPPGKFVVYGIGIGLDNHNYPMQEDFRAIPSHGFNAWATPQMTAGVQYDSADISLPIQSYVNDPGYSQGDPFCVQMFRSDIFMPPGNVLRHWAEVTNATYPTATRLIIEWVERHRQRLCLYYPAGTEEVTKALCAPEQSTPVEVEAGNESASISLCLEDYSEPQGLLYLSSNVTRNRIQKYEHGAGWSLMPARSDNDLVYSISVHNPDDLWVATYGYLGAIPVYVAHYVNGVIDWEWASGNDMGSGQISTAGGNAVFLGLGVTSHSTRGSVWVLNPGIGFSWLWTAPLTFEAHHPFPVAVTEDLGYWACSITVANGIWRWIRGTGVQQISGSGLPTAMGNGLAILDGELFIMFTNGQVWRGTWGGTFVHDNPTDGPFTPQNVGSNANWPMLALAGDKSTVCAATIGPNNGFWIRNGPDDWTNVGPTGAGGSTYGPAMANEYLLLVGDTNNSRYSINGGGSWLAPPVTDSFQGGVAGWSLPPFQSAQLDQPLEVQTDESVTFCPIETEVSLELPVGPPLIPPSGEDMPSPQVNWTDVDTVDVELPSYALDNNVQYKMQNGTSYLFSGGESIDFDATGVNGIDVGGRAVSTMYYLYLVVSGGILKAIASARDPENILGLGTGPSGHSDFLPIGAVYNDSAGEIWEFKCSGNEFRYINNRTGPIEVEDPNADGSPVQLDLLFVPVTASVALMWPMLQPSGNGYGQFRIWVDGATGEGVATEEVYVGYYSVQTWGWTEGHGVHIPIGTVPRRIHYQKVISGGAGLNTGRLISVGWVDKYRL